MPSDVCPFCGEPVYESPAEEPARVVMSDGHFATNRRQSPIDGSARRVPSARRPMNPEPPFDSRPHRRKVGYVTGEAYCERCGRAQPWPCPLANDVPPFDVCLYCDGRGWVDGDTVEDVTCPRCNGTRRQQRTEPPFDSPEAPA